MYCLTAMIIMLIIIVALAVLFWGSPIFMRVEPTKEDTRVAHCPPKRAFIAATSSLPLDQDFGPQSVVTKEGHGTSTNHLDASPALEWYNWHDRATPHEGIKEGHGTSTNHLDASPNLEWYGWHDRFRKEGHGGWSHHLDASPNLEWYNRHDQDLVAGPSDDHEPGPTSGRETFSGSRKEHYGEPPGMIRAVHRDELGFRGWADMPGDFEGSSASAISAYMQRSA